MGGTASVIGRGKFANGAVTGAFAYTVTKANAANNARQAQAQRQEGQVNVTGHRVGKVGPTHLAVEYTDANGNPVTLSAGPEGGLLVSDVNRASDAPPINFTVGVVTPPEGVTSQQYFQTLRNADAIYCNCVDYDLFPGIADSYNSNSYVHGLIQSTGGSTSVNLDQFVGGSDPLPVRNFRN